MPAKSQELDDCVMIFYFTSRMLVLVYPKIIHLTGSSKSSKAEPE